MADANYGAYDPNMQQSQVMPSNPNNSYWQPSGFITSSDPATPNPQQTTSPTQQQQQQQQTGTASQPNSSQGAQPQQIPGTPVSATGSIPAYTPPPAQPAYSAPPPPTVGGQQTDARYVQPTAAQTSYNPTVTAQTLSSNPGVSSLMNSILAKPDTLDANTIAQMKEQQKEQALLMGKQNNDALTQSILARGGGASGGLGSGFANAARTANDWATNNAILEGNRNIDVQVPQINRAAELGALTAAGGVNTSDLNADAFNAGQGQAAAASAQQANQDMWTRALAAAQAAQSAYGQDVSNSQFKAGLGFNYDNLQQNGQLAQNNILASLMAA